MTDDPTWDAAASDRFNATFDAGMARLYADKPRDYAARQVWQLAQQAAGIPIECGREACRTRGASYVGRGTGTTLYYCHACAREINRWNPGTCVLDPKGLGVPELDVAVTRRVPPPPKPRGPMSPFAALAMMSALASGVPPMPGERDLFRVPTKTPRGSCVVQDARIAKAEARRERIKARNLKNMENKG